MITHSSKAILAALFAAGNRGLQKSDLQLMLEMTPDSFASAWEQFTAYLEASTPFVLQCIEGRNSIVTDPVYGPILKRVIEHTKREPLTEGDNQTLILIAYGQPLSRRQIDFMRGTDSEWHLSKLRKLGLIAATPRGLSANSEFFYSTTDLFLASYGLSSTSDLPPCPEELVALFERCENLLRQKGVSLSDASLA